MDWDKTYDELKEELGRDPETEEVQTKMLTNTIERK